MGARTRDYEQSQQQQPQQQQQQQPQQWPKRGGVGGDQAPRFRGDRGIRNNGTADKETTVGTAGSGGTGSSGAVAGHTAEEEVVDLEPFPITEEQSRANLSLRSGIRDRDSDRTVLTSRRGMLVTYCARLNSI